MSPATVLHSPKFEESPARTVTLQTIFRDNLDFLKRHPNLPFEELDAFNDILVCKTQQCGGKVQKCGACGHRQAYFMCCGNRICPKCGGEDKEKWKEKRKALLLEGVRLFHAVAKFPRELAPLAWGANKRTILDTLIKATAATLQRAAADRLGAEIGFTSVLQSRGADR